MLQRLRTSWGILLVVAIVITISDQITKWLIADAIGREADRNTIQLIPGWLQFRYVENTGAAFGMFQDNTTMLIVLSFGVILVLLAIFWRVIQHSMLLGFAFGLQFGGAFGNLIDRIRLGYVIDFIDVPRWPAFNIADSGITVGVIMLSFVLLFMPDRAAPPESDEEAEPATTGASATGGHDGSTRSDQPYGDAQR